MTPFGLTGNLNNPIKVITVITSENGTDWNTLSPENLWIVSGLDKKLSFTDSEKVSVGQGT